MKRAELKLTSKGMRLIDGGRRLITRLTKPRNLKQRLRRLEEKWIG